MFCFESMIKVLKHYLQGTKGHRHQIITKFITIHILGQFIKTTKLHSIQELIKFLKFIHIPTVDNELIDLYKYKKDQTIYHSFDYPLKKGSQSYIYCYNVYKYA